MVIQYQSCLAASLRPGVVTLVACRRRSRHGELMLKADSAPWWTCWRRRYGPGWLGCRMWRQSQARAGTTLSPGPGCEASAWRWWSCRKTNKKNKTSWFQHRKWQLNNYFWMKFTFTFTPKDNEASKHACFDCGRKQECFFSCYLTITSDCTRRATLGLLATALCSELSRAGITNIYIFTIFTIQLQIFDFTSMRSNVRMFSTACSTCEGSMPLSCIMASHNILLVDSYISPACKKQHKDWRTWFCGPLRCGCVYLSPYEQNHIYEHMETHTHTQPTPPHMAAAVERRPPSIHRIEIEQ